MARVRHTARARADLIDIWLHVAAGNQTAADQCLDRIEAACSRLATFPELGPARPDIAPDARMLVMDLDGLRRIGSSKTTSGLFALSMARAT